MDRAGSKNAKITEKKRLRIGLYARVSSEEQEKEETIDTQIEAFKKYIPAKYPDNPIIKWYIDENVSAKLFLHERKEGKYLLADVINNQLDVVIVLRLDRLSRDDLVSQVTFHTFKEYNIDLVSINEYFDYKTPTGQLIANTFSNFASYERVVISQRFAAGRITNAGKGNWNGGHVPYGYIREGTKKEGKFVLHPEYSQNYTFIKKLALEGLGANLIREQLFSLGISSPTGESTWAKRTIIYMLRNPFYLGQLNFLDLSKDNAHPALITLEEYEQIQKNINSRGRKGKNNTYHLLSSLIQCSCGHGYTIRYHGKNNVRRYCCSQRYETVNQCPSPLIDAESLEQKIIEIIMGYAQKPAVLKEAIRAANAYAENNRIPIDMKRLAILDKQLTGLQKLIRKKDEMYSKGILDDEQYEDEVKELYERKKALQAEHETVKNELNRVAQQTGDEKKYIELVKRLNKYWDKFDSRVRQNALRELISDIQVEDDQLIINFSQFKIPLKPAMSSRGCWWFK